MLRGEQVEGVDTEQAEEEFSAKLGGTEMNYTIRSGITTSLGPLGSIRMQSYFNIWEIASMEGKVEQRMDGWMLATLIGIRCYP